jgi:hypothetical protein
VEQAMLVRSSASAEGVHTIVPDETALRSPPPVMTEPTVIVTTPPFNATMTLNAATVTITLGAPVTGAGDLRTVSGTVNMIWTPSALALDTTNIACSVVPATETGTKDRDF